MADSFKFWEMSGSWDHHMKQYEEETDVTINHTNMGYDEIIDRLQTRLLSGSDAPGLAMIEYSSLKQVADTGGLRDLTPWIEEAGIKKEFPSSIWESVSTGEETYEIPYDINPTSLFYRNDVWKKHGVSTDIETWDQLIEEGKKLPDDTALLSVPSAALNLYWRMLYWQLGGQTFDSEGNLAFDNDTSLRVFRLLHRLGDEGLTSKVTNWSQQWFNGFSEGSITGYCSGAWFNSTLQESVSDTSGKWRAMKLPAFEKGGPRASNRGGSGLCIPKQVSDDVARRTFDFALKTNANAEEMAWLFENVGNFSAYKPAYENDVFDKGFEFFGGQKLGQLWTEQIEDIPPHRFTVDTPTVMDIINTQLRKVVYGNLGPEKGLKNAVEEAKKQTNRGVA
ncbi:extracellular solute-binding protein [Haladaptatus sp. DYF46]|uniref:ABC transporter substrate-binding protein n=1 Tax=Haladaptatus sp. DYF46 TaxID=2886041 RepID=UPI001E351433|nr:extracellular solute-binding protein [Haladaptatus sp. DYF46]